MLNQLLKLYRKQKSNKTPLEDFVTEIFVGLLNIEKEIQDSFIKDFLKLPEGEYRLKTQAHYELKDDNNCIVDFVIESPNLICFIENKVNSKEGERQLERYGKVLDTYVKENFKTKLFYCTKYYDKKEYIPHEFEQIRWFQITDFLNKFRSNKFVLEFINFLTTHKMAQELTLTSQDFLTLENFQNTLNIISGHLDRVKPLFVETFKTPINISDYRKVKQIIDYNRLIYCHKGIISQNGWSELKYGFQLGKPSIYVGIWIDRKNDAFDNFSSAIKPFENEFIIKILDIGISVELKKEISEYLNDEKADTKISDWYKNAFLSFKKLIANTQELNWKINVA